MKHFGKARQAAGRLIGWSLVGLAAVVAADTAAKCILPFLPAPFVLPVVLWGVFVAFTLYFFRDPEARVPAGPNLVVSPGHGTVDVVDELEEPVFMGGRCKRVSTFLSVFNVHVQNTPVGGVVKYVKHTPGKFLNAMATESASQNENVLVGFEAAGGGKKVGVRLIAGLIARRIIPWVREGEEVPRGERMSLIQFGSRVDVYLPLTATIRVKPDDEVVGGETVLATLE